ncbi:MAG: hypothetical protein ACM37W_12800 [Actinomycetota bacterium]
MQKKPLPLPIRFKNLRFRQSLLLNERSLIIWDVKKAKLSDEQMTKVNEICSGSLNKAEILSQVQAYFNLSQGKFRC